MNTRQIVFAALLIVSSSAGFSGFAQEPGETDASVPALNAFHKVIYQIWHEAWPKKDAAMLRQLQPDVENGIASVAAAPLPGILRDKKTAWDKGVKKLKSAGADYKAAAKGKDDAKLLDAAEELHGSFEGLMRAIRPALPELEEFHAVLYMLYHHYLPKYDLENIKKSADEMSQKLDALNKANLPEPLAGKDYDFQVARTMLAQTVTALQSAIRSGNEKDIKEAVEAVHSRYQMLEEIF
jgi:hypothetical protein